MKRITDMTVAEYQRLAKKMERRFGPDKKWSELPLARKRGRPLKGDKREVLTVHSVKMSAAEWKALQAEARTLGTTVNALIRSVLRPDSLSRVVHAAGLTG
jgi:hypothetical protein